MVDNTGEYPPTINLDYVSAGDTLKIKLLLPNISPNNKFNKIELYQGTYANKGKFITYLNFDSSNIAQ